MTQAPGRPLRLGVFGGAFDPPHLAHRLLLEAAIAQLQLDRLQVVPTGQAWHKTRALSAAAHRMAMAQLAFADLPCVQVDGREIARSGASYTVETLRELRREQPGAELFLLIGQDQAVAFTSWYQWRAIAEMATVCVAARADALGQASPFVPPPGLESRFCLLQLPATAISATDIRQRVAAGQAIDALVCAPVARYIALHRLYQTP